MKKWSKTAIFVTISVPACQNLEYGIDKQIGLKIKKNSGFRPNFVNLLKCY